MTEGVTQQLKGRPFSVVRFFRLFEKAIAETRTYPLTTKNLVIQQDAYRRLADADTQDGMDELDFEFFATLEYGRKERDSDLCFSISFAAEVFQLSIENVGAFTFAYNWYFKNEDIALKQLMTALTMLCNGQLSVLVTTRYHGECAVELLLYDGDSRVPLVLHNEAYYPWWWRRNDTSEYDTRVMRNSLIRRKIEVPEYFFMADYDSKKQLTSNGRLFTTPEITPLVKEEYLAAQRRIYARIRQELTWEVSWVYAYKELEFWAVLVIIAVVCIGVYAAGAMPNVVRQNPIVFAPLLGLLTSVLLVTLLHRKKARHKARQRKTTPAPKKVEK